MGATPSNNKNSSEEYLKDYIENKDFKEETENQDQEEVRDLGNIDDMQYHTLDVSELPCKRFYPAGTTVKIRAASVKEIQAFSTVDDKNIYDIYEKSNMMLSKCVRLKLPNGKLVSWNYIIDHDRWYLLFAIKEFTFQKSQDLTVTVDDVVIPIRRENFEFYDVDEKLEKFWDKHNGCFVFPTKMGKEFRLAPPTLGLQKSITDFMVDEMREKKEKPLPESFLKIVPYTLIGMTSITPEGIKKHLNKFENEYTKEEFSFLNSAVNKLKFGIKGVTKTVSGQEVHSSSIFPTGISGLFVSPDAFDDFIEW
jgi:hypothetical protein